MNGLVLAADVRTLPLVIFGIVLAITLAITYWASRRTRTATDFWAAGRGISPLQNGFAIAGDFMSAAAFLGVSGLMFLYGFAGRSASARRARRRRSARCSWRRSTSWRR